MQLTFFTDTLLHVPGKVSIKLNGCWCTYPDIEHRFGQRSDGFFTGNIPRPHFILVRPTLEPNT